MKFRFQGKEKLASFGKYPTVSLAEARELKDKARKLLAKGMDPNAEKKRIELERKLLNNNTFKQIAAAYIEKREKEGRAESTIRKLHWLIEVANEGFGNVPVTDIDSRML